MYDHSEGNDAAGFALPVAGLGSGGTAGRVPENVVDVSFPFTLNFDFDIAANSKYLEL